MEPLLPEQVPAWWLAEAGVAALVKSRVEAEAQRALGLVWWEEVQAQELQVHPMELQVQLRHALYQYG